MALIIGVAAAGLWIQTAAHAARQDAAPQTRSAEAVREDPGTAGRGDKLHPGRTPPFHGLLAATEPEVTGRLGAPDLSRAEGAGAMWTYRLPDCALFVFFRRSGVEGLKVSGAASGPRMRGRNPPPVNECLAEAFERRVAEGPKAGR
ncbi:MAG TPA: hypothetical protein VIJ94_11485 [Caulobacteraceae bacterium]